MTGLEWDEADRRWIVRSDRGDAIRARFVFMANGPLSRPKLPGIPGVETFEGHSFHTSRWDYAYTGGDTTGGLHRLADKRVGIIGTGATAIQCIPHLGAFAKRLTVFQRTPSSVDARHNRPTDPEFAKQLAPGWQQARMDNFNTLVGGGYQEVDLVGDGWTDVFRILMATVRGEGAVDLSPEEIARRAGYDLVGRGGLALSEKWKDRMSTFQGFYSRGFPNCFFMLGLQSGLTPNIPHAINEQAKHLAFVVAHALRHGLTQVEASEAAERDLVALIRAGEGRRTEFFESCTPGYYNNEGKPGEGDGWFGGFHPEGSEALFRLYREWRSAGRFDGLEFA